MTISLSLSQNNLYEKKKGKKQVSSSSPTIPPIPKRARTKIQANKYLSDARVQKNLKLSKDRQSSNRDSSLISRKIRELVPDDKI